MQFRDLVNNDRVFHRDWYFVLSPLKARIFPDLMSTMVKDLFLDTVETIGLPLFYSLLQRLTSLWGISAFMTHLT